MLKLPSYENAMIPASKWIRGRTGIQEFIEVIKVMPLRHIRGRGYPSYEICKRGGRIGTNGVKIRAAP